MSIGHDQASGSLRQDEVAKRKKSVPSEDIDGREKLGYRAEESHVGVEWEEGRAASYYCSTSPRVVLKLHSFWTNLMIKVQYRIQ